MPSEVLFEVMMTAWARYVLSDDPRDERDMKWSTDAYIDALERELAH